MSSSHRIVDSPRRVDSPEYIHHVKDGTGKRPNDGVVASHHQLARISQEISRATTPTTSGDTYSTPPESHNSMEDCPSVDGRYRGDGLMTWSSGMSDGQANLPLLDMTIRADGDDAMQAQLGSHDNAAEVGRNNADQSMSLGDLSSNDKSMCINLTDSETETDEDEDDDEDDLDDEGSGEVDNLEHLVLSVIPDDLIFAAYIIPRLHKYLSFNVNQKVANWQVNTCPAGEAGVPVSAPGDGDRAPAAHTNQTPPSRNKRRRLSSEGHEDYEDREEDEEGDPAGLSGLPDARSENVMLRLACPFNKSNAAKYSVDFNAEELGLKPDHYKLCGSGPGWKSIHHLKEHLKRKHRLAQCKRCCQMFCLRSDVENLEDLERHLETEQCVANPTRTREGITDAQWAKLDKRNAPKKRRGVTGPTPEPTRVEKWSEIWLILFPNTDPPSPWFERISRPRPYTQSDQRNAMRVLLYEAINFEMSDGNIIVQSGEQGLRQCIDRIVDRTGQLMMGITGQSSQQDSSSSRTGILRASRNSGSSTQTSASWNSSARHTTVTALTAPSPGQSYALGTANAAPYATVSGRRRNTIVASPLNPAMHQPEMSIHGRNAMGSYPHGGNDMHMTYLPLLQYDWPPPANTPFQHMGGMFATASPQDDLFGASPGFGQPEEDAGNM